MKIGLRTEQPNLLLRIVETKGFHNNNIAFAVKTFMAKKTTLSDSGSPTDAIQSDWMRQVMQMVEILLAESGRCGETSVNNHMEGTLNQITVMFVLVKVGFQLVNVHLPVQT